MDTRLGYLGGVISIVIAFFPENNGVKFAFGSIGVIGLVIAYIFQGRTSLKKETKPLKKAMTKKQKTLELSSGHLLVFKVFRRNEGKLISASLIEKLTGMEIVVINSILNDLEQYNLIHATNLDDFEYGWQYQLSNKGRKALLNFT